MVMDTIIRKKVLKIQERLGMRIGVNYGSNKIPVVRTTSQTLEVLRDLYKVGLKAFVLPKELFAGISSASDLYKSYYGDLLKIRDIANKFSIELALHHPSLSDQPDETLKTFCSIASIMDCRTFIIHPTFYSNMPQDQALRLVVYKINEIVTGLRTSAKIGIETTGRLNELGSLEDVIDIVKRTRDTEPVVNWAHVHARGSGALRGEDDFRRVFDKVRGEVGQSWLSNIYFLFSGVSYGPSGMIKHIPLSESDISLKMLIRQSISFGAKGTLIFEDPQKEKFILKVLEDLGDMVR
ncbi:MAG: hypothetical protein KAU24_01015 [Candidatus Aenigmarchaeota archaeon]|nr:hypothetical protein [Candidatus Aenigmarchaeota archaeon]